MYDIITFGSAIRDFFLFLEKDLCLPLDEKMFIENFSSINGGGGINTAMTFAKQGLKIAYCGKIGNDIEGQEMIKEMKNHKIGVDLVKIDKSHKTSCSVIFSFVGKRQRTIFIGQGASFFFNERDIIWSKIKQTKWFYLSPFHGQSIKVFRQLVDFAYKNKIKTAINPSKEQLMEKKSLLADLKKVDLLFLNQAEGFLLTDEKDEKKCLAKLLGFGVKIAAITKGSHGAIISDGQYIYKIEAPNVAIKETTGAGDAFGSGFLSGFWRKNDILYASKLAMANSTSCVQKIGAHNGLLAKGEKGLMDKIKVKKYIL